MHVLVAGATGVLGRAVVPRLLEGGHEVLAVSRRTDADRWLGDVGARPVRLDLFDADAATRLVTDEGVTAVVNLATNVPRGHAALRRTAWRTHLRLRREASRALATAAIDVGASFVQESFAPAYPDRGAAWIEEDVSLRPVAQAATVPDAEASADQVTSCYGTGVVLRFGMFYGPDASDDLIAAARRGWFLLPGRPEAYASMVHVDDAAVAVAAALTAPAGVYNVVESQPVTRAEHAAILAQLLGVPRLRRLPSVLSRLPAVELITRSQRISNARLARRTGWYPRYPDPRSGWSQVIRNTWARR